MKHFNAELMMVAFIAIPLVLVMAVFIFCRGDKTKIKAARQVKNDVK